MRISRHVPESSIYFSRWIEFRLPRVFLHALALVFTVVAGRLNAQTSGYERRELTIPVRDGTKLHAVALIPRGPKPPLPILLIRTPFGAANEFRNEDLPAMYKELGEDGYIFVTEDARGRAGSGERS
jgi:Predicted acyl esterases